MNKIKQKKRFYEKLATDFNMPADAVSEKILTEYGAMFVAADLVAVPKKTVFRNETEVAAWQKSVKTAKRRIGGIEIELQAAAMKALEKVVREAAENGLTVTPRGFDAARRDYEQTIDLWASRVNPALEHWVKRGKLTEAEAQNLRAMTWFEQVAEVLRYEAEGLFFSKDLTKTIMYSVAPPGASQHLAMLALDVEEHANLLVRRILARHCWYQTVISDLPHFTFLGIAEKELPDYGLKKITNNERDFWIPDL